MGNISLDLSKKIDSKLAELLQTIHDHMQALKLPFFIVGATARDLVLEMGYGIRVGRLTLDLDLAVMIEQWEAYDRLKSALVSAGKFIADSREHNRIVYQNSWPVDLIPFGQIESPAGIIAWPPDQAVRMKVMGFREILDRCLMVRIHKDLIIPVAPLAGIGVMKIIAWNDRHAERDVEDLVLLLKHYAQAGNEDRLYGEHEAILIAEGHDHERAGARLLGHDMAGLMAGPTRVEVLAILDNYANPDKNDRLIIAIGRQLGMDRYEEAQALLECLRKGLDEVVSADTA